jgi:hypothetical protein
MDMATMDTQRGSAKLMAAWKARALTEDAVREIATQFEQSPGKVQGADVVGGAAPTGVRVSVSYEGDDTPWCGNDILFWLKWHRIHGGSPRPPRIIINGTPYPDLVRVQLDFGHVPEQGFKDLGGTLAGEGFGG